MPCEIGAVVGEGVVWWVTPAHRFQRSALCRPVWIADHHGGAVSHSLLVMCIGVLVFVSVVLCHDECMTFGCPVMDAGHHCDAVCHVVLVFVLVGNEMDEVGVL